MKNIISNNKQLQQMLDEPITRKQFLKHMGTIGMSVVGVNAVVSAIVSPKNVHKTITIHEKTAKGFGSSKFGV